MTPHAEPRGSIEMLRGITRSMATAEDLDKVLESVVDALVEHADATLARIFLLQGDQDCGVCRGRIEAGQQTATSETALHLVAAAGHLDDIGGLFHRVPRDSALPVAQVTREGVPYMTNDWRQEERYTRDSRISQLWAEMDIHAIAGCPLDFRGERLGAIAYLCRREISNEEFQMLGIFADQAAMAIKSAYMFRELHGYRDRLEKENAYLQDEIRVDRGFDHIVGESTALRAVLRKVRQVASVETTVLLTGETGTGKELIARAIHESSPRKDRPMIKVNCGAIPAGVVESELFGHEKGAFTGAIQRRIGRFELADKGTLFMDEVGELTLDTQVKLLRVLQEQEFERVGSTQAMKVDVRLIAATNRDLEREVAEQRFRPDLFYRLNVFPIRVPPLRERPSDIPVLVQHFLAHFQRKLGKPLKTVKPSSLDQMVKYPWPGNIRELQNVVERACVLARTPEVELPDALRTASVPVATREVRFATLDENERACIRRALAAVKGRIHGPQGAAALLGVNPSTLRSRMQKLGIGKEQ